MSLHPNLQKIEPILLMGPGPSCVHPSVYEAMAKPTMGHLDSQFLSLMEDVKQQLRTLFRTKNLLTFPISGTGSAGMEACFVNLIEEGDPVLVLVNGVFGKRMVDVATRLKAKVDTLEFAWGQPVEVEQVADKLNHNHYKIVAIVHAETSTGVTNPVAKIGHLLKTSDTLYLVDTVTSLGGMPVTVDEWGADAVYSGTQKCLSCPPGLAPATFSDRALEVIKKRKTKVPNWYLDLSMIMNYWEGHSRVYHHTAPINMIYGLHQALTLILEEGLENVEKRHQEVHQQLVQGLESLGLQMLVAPEYRLPMLNSVLIPEKREDLSIRRSLREQYHIEIGAGLGPLTGKIWRIGLMGYTAYPHNVNRLLDALRSLL